MKDAESVLSGPGDLSGILTKQASAPETLTRPLLRGRTTLAEALEEEENMLLRLTYPSQRFDFFLWILQHRKDFEAIVLHHLCLAARERCRLGEVREWKHGSFNVCIPIHVDNWTKHPGKRVLLSGRIGILEMRTRNYALKQPHFFGFTTIARMFQYLTYGVLGFRVDRFMKPENAPFSKRMIWYLQRAISSFFRSPLPCPYVSYNRQYVLEHGYLIMEYIEASETKMLSETWIDLYQNQELRENLFRDLSRIILSLSQLPLPCIGSWTIDKRDVLKLTNRPLIHQFQSLENEGIPTNIARTLTYTTADSYYIDLLTCHDSRIRNQPNSIVDEKDGRAQMANLFAMRGLLSHFTRRDLRQGPFVFNLTDLHGSNIFVDCNWHIKYIIDLEWACSTPVEMLTPPYWMTNRAVDELEGDELQKFENAYQGFMDIFEEEEKSFAPTYGSASYRTDIMRRGWKIGNFWYFHALKSPKGLYNLFWQHIQPIYEPRGDNLKPDVDGFAQIISPYWAPDVREVVANKLEDKKKYEQKLRELFEKCGSL